ncbi:hypothetical protein AAEX37_00575 [Oligella sp. MSHR50489EDL]|uniref:DUF4265 domain-containing protein n=1 Tax=Alcaligenaceae TaxID=506 RepID=UPI0008DA2796|nr:DUF4265 domain-containing protein [Pelistega sp. MC2]
MDKKIFFKLEVVNNYPPVDEESLWAKELQNGLFEIDNIPFYTKEVSLGDLVSTVRKDDVLYFKKVEKNSANNTLRVIFLRSDEFVVTVSQYLTQLGCEIEKFSEKFMALSVDNLDVLASVLEYLELMSEQGILDYETGKLNL